MKIVDRINDNISIFINELSSYGIDTEDLIMAAKKIDHIMKKIRN